VAGAAACLAAESGLCAALGNPYPQRFGRTHCVQFGLTASPLFLRSRFTVRGRVEAARSCLSVTPRPRTALWVADWSQGHLFLSASAVNQGLTSLPRLMLQCRADWRIGGLRIRCS
jgi:hypothetical protein